MDYSSHYDELMRNLKIVKDRVRGVVHGQATGLYLHGRPGTSKTYTVCTTLEALGASYVQNSGHLTPIGLVDLLADNLDRVIVLDDVSAIFNQPVALQILLAALGNPHDGSSVRLVKHRTAKDDKVVAFSGGIICLSNLALDGHHNEVLAAIRDRIHVIHYEPTEDQITALILHMCEDGVGGLAPEDATMVANHLIELSKLKGIRLSVRLFAHKAIKDYQLWASGKSETHWQDLVRSSVEQQLIELQHGTRDLSRDERTEAERRIALDVCLRHGSREERVEAWTERTGKSQAAFYRRKKELEKEGVLPSKVRNADALRIYSPKS